MLIYYLQFYYVLDFVKKYFWGVKEGSRLVLEDHVLPEIEPEDPHLKRVF